MDVDLCENPNNNVDVIPIDEVGGYRSGKSLGSCAVQPHSIMRVVDQFG